MSYRYLTSCVDCDDVDLLTEMIDTMTPITYRTIRHKLGPQLDQWAKEKGYDRQLSLKRDWHVTFHKGRYGLHPCLVVCWSAIEFIWIEEPRRQAVTRPTA